MTENDTLRTWLHHCEESGNFTGAAEALYKLEMRNADPQKYDNEKYNKDENGY